MARRNHWVAVNRFDHMMRRAADAETELLKMAQRAIKKASYDICEGCGGPHQFDTSVPSVIWNKVMRDPDRQSPASEFLCASCVLKEFALAGVSFAAELTGGELHGVGIVVMIGGQEANAVAKIQDENNHLRWELRVAHEALAKLRGASPQSADAVDPHVGDSNE